MHRTTSGCDAVRMIRVEAESAARAVVERDARVAGDHARAKRVRQAVDEGNRVAVAIGYCKIARVAGMFRHQRTVGPARAAAIDFSAAEGGVLLGDQCIQRPLYERRVARVAVAIGKRELLRFDEKMNALGTERRELPDVETFDDVEL